MPIRTVVLGSDGLQATSIGFGCAGLFRLPGRGERAQVLDAAYDAGIRHFDVAPMYGLGLAERELGRFARTRRSELTIATKFGITPTFTARGLARVQGPLRQLLAARQGVHNAARERLSTQSRLLYSCGGYGPAAAQRGLERSLRALRTGHVDVFLLHDPAPGSVRADDVMAYLEHAQSRGLLRSWGVAGEPALTDEVAASFRMSVPIRQVPGDVLHRSPPLAEAGSARITYGAISGALSGLLGYLSAADSVRSRWAEAIGADCGDPDVAASFLWRAAFRENSSGVVLFSTTRPSRVRDAVRACERSSSADDPALDVFLRLVSSELRAGPRAGSGAAI